jgi:hypothetical protein
MTTVSITRDEAENTLRYDAVRSGPLVLTPEEAEKYEKQVLALKKLLEDKSVVAKYKLEILFGKGRSTSEPTHGVMSFWHSGARFHGGGDDKLYICPGASLQRSNCHALMQDSYNVTEGIVCPACGTIWKHEEVIGELFFNLPMRKWATAVYRYFRLLEYNCDIYLKFAPDDIRTVALAQADKQTFRGSCRLENVRAKRARAIYPLRNIIKDTSAGADLLSRIYSFLTA